MLLLLSLAALLAAHVHAACSDYNAACGSCPWPLGTVKAGVNGCSSNGACSWCDGSLCEWDAVSGCVDLQNWGQEDSGCGGFTDTASAATQAELETALASSDSICIEITADIPLVSSFLSDAALGITSGQSVKLYSTAGATLNGQGSTQILHINDGSQTVHLEGLRFYNGLYGTTNWEDVGGAIAIWNNNRDASQTLTVTRCKFVDNVAGSYGGAVFSYQAHMIFNQCEFIGNIVTQRSFIGDDGNDSLAHDSSSDCLIGAGPSAVPTSVPTSLPTSLPTSVPTSLPTSLPSAAPAPGSEDMPVPTSVPSPVPTFQAIVDSFDEAVEAYSAVATTVSTVAATTAAASVGAVAATSVVSAGAGGAAGGAAGGSAGSSATGDPLVMASQMQFVCASAMLQAGLPDSYRDVAASFRWASMQYGIPGLSLDGRKMSNTTTSNTTTATRRRRLSFFGNSTADEDEEEEEEDAVSGYLRALGLSAEEVFLGNLAWVGLVGGCVYALHLWLLKMLCGYMSKRGHPHYEPPVALQPPGLEMTMSLCLFPGLVQAASICLFASGAFVVVRVFAGLALVGFVFGVFCLAFYLWRGCDPKSPVVQVRFEPDGDDAAEKKEEDAAKPKAKDSAGVKISYLTILIMYGNELFGLLVQLFKDTGGGEWKPVKETGGHFQRLFAVIFEKFKGSAYYTSILDLVRKILEAVVYAALAGGASWQGRTQTALLTCIAAVQAVYVMAVEPYGSKFTNIQSVVRDGAQFCVLAYAFLANLGLVPPETVAAVVMLLNFFALGVLVLCQLLGLVEPLSHLFKAASKVAAVLPTMKFDSRSMLNSIGEARKVVARVMSASSELNTLLNAALEGAVEEYQEAYQEAVGAWREVDGDDRAAANKLAVAGWHSAGLTAAAAFLTSRSDSEGPDEDAEPELEASVRLWKKLGDSVLGSGGDDSPCPREFFETFDADGNGFLSEYAFTLTLVTMGIHLAMDEQAHLLKCMNRDGDGNVSFDEFARLFVFAAAAHLEAEEEVAKAKQRAAEEKRAAANHTAVAVGVEGGAAAKYAAPAGDDQLAALDEDRPAADDAAPDEDGNKPATMHSTGSIIKADMALITTTTLVGAFDEDINDDASLVEAIKAAVIDRLAGYVSSTLHPDVDRGVENAPLAIQLIPGFTGMCKSVLDMEVELALDLLLNAALVVAARLAVARATAGAPSEVVAAAGAQAHFPTLASKVKVCVTLCGKHRRTPKGMKQWAVVMAGVKLKSKLRRIRGAKKRQLAELAPLKSEAEHVAALDAATTSAALSLALSEAEAALKGAFATTAPGALDAILIAIARAQTRLARMSASVEKLRTAFTSTTPGDLEAAVASAEAAGQHSSEAETGRALLKERRGVERQLSKALESKSAMALRIGVARSQACGFSGPALDAATARVRVVDECLEAAEAARAAHDGPMLRAALLDAAAAEVHGDIIELAERGLEAVEACAPGEVPHGARRLNDAEAGRRTFNKRAACGGDAPVGVKAAERIRRRAKKAAMADTFGNDGDLLTDAQVKKILREHPILLRPKVLPDSAISSLCDVLDADQTGTVSAILLRKFAVDGRGDPAALVGARGAGGRVYLFPT